MNKSIFLVDDKPYVIWDRDVSSRNIEFLNGLDTEYFDYIIEIHSKADDKLHASIALRTTLYNAMETFFTLFGAFVQAPGCVYAWINKCTNVELRKVIKKISSTNTNLFTAFDIDSVSWENLTKVVFESYSLETEKNIQTTQLFAEYWKKLSKDFIDSKYIDEYNSLKHGFRIRPGGFSLSIGIEHEAGTPPLKEEMVLLGRSKYGTTFYKIESIEKNQFSRNLRSKKLSINWTIEQTILHFQLISISIKNIISALKIANGIKLETCKFQYPLDCSIFNKVWSCSSGVLSFGVDNIIQPEQKNLLSKEDLLKIIKNQSKSN